MQQLQPEIDKIYVSEPYGFKQLMTKQFVGYKYRKSGILLNSGVKKITRFAKDYKIGATRFTLLVVSFNNSAKVEAAMDACAEAIKSDNKLKSLVASSTMRPLSVEVKV